MRLPFQGHDGGEIEPFEEGLDLFKSGVSQQSDIFFQGKGDQDVFQGLAFGGDFKFRIALLFFKGVINIDEIAIEPAGMGDGFFTEKEDAAFGQCLIDASDKRLPGQRAEKL